jgi:uncharacterized lipoprotein YajG
MVIQLTSTRYKIIYQEKAPCVYNKKQDIARLLMIGLSAGSLALAGCGQNSTQTGTPNTTQESQAQASTPAASASATATTTAETAPETAQRRPDVVYVPTPNEVVLGCWR